MAKQPIHVHVHIDSTGVGEEILAQLTEMKAQMTDLNTAMDALSAQQVEMAARIDEDVAHQADIIAQLSALLDTAMANDAADAAAIADITAQRDALLAEAGVVTARINETTAALAAIDPLTDFPVVEPPA
jgi:TolA-binding protein